MMSRGHKPEKYQDFKDRLADTVVQVNEFIEQQKNRLVVYCGDEYLEISSGPNILDLGTDTLQRYGVDTIYIVMTYS